MIELVSWIGVGIIALFAVVGFTGVVVTSLVSLVRMVGERRTQDHAQVQPAVPVR